MSYTSATKKVLSGSGTTIIKRIEDLDKKSDLFQTEIEDVKTRRATLRYNYAIRDKELDVQKEELNFERPMQNSPFAGNKIFGCSTLSTRRLRKAHLLNKFKS